MKNHNNIYKIIENDLLTKDNENKTKINLPIFDNNLLLSMHQKNQNIHKIKLISYYII